MRIQVPIIMLAGLLCTLDVAARLPDFTDLVEEISPAVVKVNVIFKGRSEPSRDPYGGQLPDIFRELLEQQRRQQQERPRGSSVGSGFVISSDGYILTNHHVVNGGDEIRVEFADRREFEAIVIGSDRRSDLALLKINAENLASLELAKSDGLRVGEWVLAIGSPFGLDYSVTAGIVSAIGRSIPTEKNEMYVPFIQTDVAINPGNSGGPLFDLDGQVVGINSQIYSRSGGSIGLSFAIPASVALNVVAQLKATGRVDRGWLGVAIQDVDQQLARSLNLAEAKGALVSAVELGSPAEVAGVVPGDVIFRFNQKQIIESSDLPPVVGRVTPGDRVSVDIFRDGEKKTLMVTVAALDQNETSSSKLGSRDGGSDRLGLRVEDLGAEMQRETSSFGVIISRVAPQSPGSNAGLQRGDVILQLGQSRIENSQDYGQLLSKLPENTPVPIRFMRRGRAIFRTIQIYSE